MVFSESTRGPPSATSCSVPNRPATPAIVNISVPEVLTNGLPEPFECRPDRLDNPQVGSRCSDEVAGAHRFVLEGQVDDTVGCGGRLPDAVEIIQVAAEHLRTGG